MHATNYRIAPSARIVSGVSGREQQYCVILLNCSYVRSAGVLHVRFVLFIVCFRTAVAVPKMIRSSWDVTHSVDEALLGVY